MESDRRTSSKEIGKFTASDYGESTAATKPKPVITGDSQAQGIAKFAHRMLPRLFSLLSKPSESARCSCRPDQHASTFGLNIARSPSASSINSEKTRLLVWKKGITVAPLPYV